jgi:hypothetical protein
MYDTFQEIADLNANPIDVRTCQSCDNRRTLSMIYAQGISYEVVEDNLLNWKCAIKGAVRFPPPSSHLS